ncbi:4Fe-4S cluster-binding domain-containing protein [Acinetobacter haemolyticus]|uniref:4Fe-4S cluster-binding domain-containing protein n=1 Tax=Acinetobacter haemolyticus TaxID=29430 RepID=UPI001E622C61
MQHTSYQLEELNDNRFKGASKLLQVTDILVDGEYQQELTENVRNWVGSTNQQFYYLTEFYTDEIETRALNVTNEWRIDRQGSILGNGLPFILRA